MHYPSHVSEFSAAQALERHFILESYCVIIYLIVFIDFGFIGYWNIIVFLYIQLMCIFYFMYLYLHMGIEPDAKNK